ncbi:ATP-dependent helicase HrpB [Corynebacterium aquilae]|uniref:Helicase n=1 Tax=Corynebacterium aquilae DSM 44791 TaxID=1431546 RepID=A0A1L7CD77_9CORY|nr:ATP-dependent helicase HrpB [Corynebacterium aquilae]APT83787.1 hypothetical protein CAQU_00310 [Corynebacterium aquilae DSM 44791]
MKFLFPVEDIGHGLPVSRIVSSIPTHLRQHQRAIITAPPGTGKTTLVPPVVANMLGQCSPTRPQVVVVAPRRVAVRAAARRLAQLSDTSLGDVVGYQVRGENHPGSVVTFVTPGVLIRRLLDDPELHGVGAVIVDEVHERQLDTDVALALALEAAELIEDLHVVAMSATIDARKFSRLMGDAPIIDTPAVLHPLEVIYSPAAGRLAVSREFLQHVAHEAASQFAQQSAQGYSVLVFVPGVREIRIVMDALADRGVNAYPLHGRLTPQEQDAAMYTDEPRVVVSTAVAESSVTVPGVRAVVDAGLSRAPRRDHGRDMAGLVTVSCARPQAEQRAGRAGREGPGVVVRCFSALDFQKLADGVTPEIVVSDLTQMALVWACWGTPRAEGLPLLDAPPQRAVVRAEESLRAIGAVDATGHVTASGELLARVPVDPRLAHALFILGEKAAPIAAVVGDDPRGDIARALKHPQEKRLARLAATHGQRYRELREGTQGFTAVENLPPTAGVVVGLAYPHRLARRVSETTGHGASGGEPVFLTTGGTRVRVPHDVGLQDAQWLAIASVDRADGVGTQGAPRLPVVRAAARIDEGDVLAIMPLETTTTAQVDSSGSTPVIRGRAVRRIGAIELSSQPVKLTPHTLAAALEDAIATQGPALFPDFSSAETQALLARLRFAHDYLGGLWPAVDEDSLTADAVQWLAPECEAVAGGMALAKVDMTAAVRRLVPWQYQQVMGELLPAGWEAPSGRVVPIDYSGEHPQVSLKLQECFGITSHPVVGRSQVVKDPAPETPMIIAPGIALTVHLLSPAGRPLAVTADLPGFFAGTYQDVKKEMKGRYPKHPWPDDPFTAPATSLTKKRAGLH